MTNSWKVLLGGGLVVGAGLIGVLVLRPQPAVAAPTVTVYASPT